MNKFKLTTLSFAAIAAIAFTGCGGGGGGSSTTTTTASCDSNYIDEVLPSDISTDTTLDASLVYGMNGKVKVTGDSVLTIPAGTTIAGCTASSFMVITPGSQINATGTQAKPIVFTSQTDVKGNSSANSAGEWGGLVLAGNAYTHSGVVAYEADEDVEFGSADHTNDTESSGTLQYVVIKHSGYEVEKDKELNGLSLAGVGSGTTIENVAIIGGLDDGLEIWGGTVNIDGLYVYNAQDDSVDTDLGYRGTISNVLVQQVNVDSTNNHDSAGMEFGNDNNTIVTDDDNATQPTIINYTGYILGGGFYNKYDAGFIWNNVKFVSDKTADYQQIHFRGTDSYTTGAKHIYGDVCFSDTAVTLAADNTTYSDENSKDTNTSTTALAYFVTNAATTLSDSNGTVYYDDSASCAGATEADIWKGKAGSNSALETPSNALDSEITTDTTLTADTVWLINGKVNVKSGATLTIEPGTTLAGATASSYMVIEPGAQIDAQGTIDEPIVFTSLKDVNGYSADNSAGEWGGLVIAGNAYTHYSDNTYEADETVSFGSTTHTNDTESSGTLQYVVIKHTGYEVEKDKELNGLSLAGVGSGTTIENVAIIGGLDDGLEIWGGTVNIDGLYVYNAQDDSVDTDLGYRGTISNVLVQQVNVDSTNNHDSAGMEFGNDHNTIVTDDDNATQPTIVNYTGYILGGGISLKYDAGVNVDNVKFVSAKTADTEQVFFRGEDTYDTNATNIDGDICFKDTAVTLDEAGTYAASNSKDSSTTKTAYTAWAAATRDLHSVTGTIYLDDSSSCTGATESTIWKGTAGSYDALED